MYGRTIALVRRFCATLRTLTLGMATSYRTVALREGGGSIHVAAHRGASGRPVRNSSGGRSRAMSLAARTMTIGMWALTCTSSVLAQENIAPFGMPIIGAASNLTSGAGVIVDHLGPIDEVNDGVFNPNLAPNGYAIDGDGLLGPNG